MFEVAHRKKWGIRLKDVYYAETIREKDPNYDAVYYFFCQEDKGSSKKYLTTAVNLRRNEEMILSSFRKSTRQDIKRIMNDENLKIETTKTPSVQQIKSFILRYNQFTRKKGFDVANHYQVLTLNRAGRIVLLKALYANELVLEQIMIEDEHKAVALYGYTIRLKESDPGKLRLISSISKMVDYYCMIYWMKKNKEYYDLGGLFLDPANPDGEKIDHYKEGFRGEIITEYEFVYPLTWKGKFFYWAKEQMKRIKRWTHTS